MSLRLYSSTVNKHNRRSIWHVYTSRKAACLPMESAQLKGISCCCRDHVSSRTVNTSSFQIYICDAHGHIDRCPIGFQHSVAFSPTTRSFFFSNFRDLVIGFFFIFSLCPNACNTRFTHIRVNLADILLKKLYFGPTDKSVHVHPHDTIFENRVKEMNRIQSEISTA